MICAQHPVDHVNPVKNPPRSLKILRVEIPA